MRIPYKITLEDTNVSYFEISMTWDVSNPNPYPIYMDSYVRLINRGGGYAFWDKTWVKWWTDSGGRGGPGEKVERVWFLYRPIVGVEVDFSQKLFLESAKGNMGSEAIYMTRLEYGDPGEMYQIEAATYERELRYIPAPYNFVPSPNVRSRLTSLQRLPAGFQGSYITTLRIPGPTASLGMAQFWNAQDSPDFDLEVRPSVFPYWDDRNGRPSSQNGAEMPLVLRRPIIKNAFELDVKKGRQAVSRSDSYEQDYQRGD